MKPKYILILGDVLALLIVTLIGFATHGETGLSFLPRLVATFIPLVIAWFLLAPWFGLFDIEINSTPTLPPPFSFGKWGRCHGVTEGVKVGVVMLFAAPLAATLRGLILNSSIVPIFVVVLGGTSALGMVIWRMLYYLLHREAR